MSALDDAIRARMEELHPGRPVMAWAVVAATLLSGEETEHGMTVLGAPGQPAYGTAGLLHLGLLQIGGEE
jgi:hypothetical protein